MRGRRRRGGGRGWGLGVREQRLSGMVVRGSSSSGGGGGHIIFIMIITTTTTPHRCVQEEKVRSL